MCQDFDRDRVDHFIQRDSNYPVLGRSKSGKPQRQDEGE
jgi:hypothetical protein